jgi:hypothetical protein
MIAKYGIPNKAFPHCTRELKRQTITRYLRTIGLNNGKYETAIGIRIDEAHRINWQNAKRDRFIYPLATDFRATKDFIRTWWDRQDFDLQLKDYEGNCDMCWKKSERKLLTMILENPNLLDWWNEMEIKYGEGEFTFFRKNKSAIDLIELSKQKFRKANDEHEANKNYLIMIWILNMIASANLRRVSLGISANTIYTHVCSTFYPNIATFLKSNRII